MRLLETFCLLKLLKTVKCRDVSSPTSLDAFSNLAIVNSISCFSVLNFISVALIHGSLFCIANLLPLQGLILGVHEASEDKNAMGPLPEVTPGNCIYVLHSCRGGVNGASGVSWVFCGDFAGD